MGVMDNSELRIDSTEDKGFDTLVEVFESTHCELQRRAIKAVDTSLVVRNWLFGWYIEEFEKGGASRKELYGKKLVEKLSKRLTQSLGKGFSKRTLEQFIKFYESYKKITQTVSAQSSIQNEIELISSEIFSSHFDSDNLQKITQTVSAQLPLSWSHYLLLIPISNLQERSFYEIESLTNGWSVRELDRQINSSLFERLALSTDKAGVQRLAQEGQIVEKPSDMIKDPYILEFTGLEQRPSYSESELESALISQIENFLLELGKGFLFESRQKRFTFDNRHFFVDLVFYNRLLRSYVLIDLKIGDLKHQDLGQMQMYVNYFDRYVKTDEENQTVGILLCHSKSDDLVELTLPQDANIYASKYQLYLPDPEELKSQLAEAEAIWEKTQELKMESGK